MSLWFSADQPSSQRLCSDQGLPSSSQNAPSTRFSCSRAGFTDLGMVDHQGWLLQQGVPFHLIHLRLVAVDAGAVDVAVAQPEGFPHRGSHLPGADFQVPSPSRGMRSPLAKLAVCMGGGWPGGVT